jgi:hypothetical protein
MPNWKKVITSGSDASLNTLSVTNNTHLSGSLNVFKSGGTVFTIEGSQGTLFQITDELSGSLFSVADISGVPSFEVFSDDTVKLGTFGSEAVVVEGDVLKLSQLSNQSSETTAVVINGSNVVGTRELGSNAFTSTTIPTNNNQLTNGAGYITDGNTNWNNSYGFITATSTDTLTNKSGNISMFTNDAGYITDGNTGWNNSYGFITGVDWGELGGDQADINISGFNNDSGFTSNIGDITGVTAGTGISGGGTSGTVTITNSDRGSSQNIFKNVAVSGQTTIVADSNNDTLTFAAGAGIGLTTNATTDTITITNSITNNNQLTNGAGYITDGNQNWNNSYGFITGLNWTELGGAQEEINISGFNNDAGYTTNTGTLTSLTINTSAGLDGGGTYTTTGTATISLDLSELTDMTTAIDTAVDEIILLDNGAERRKRFSEIFGSNAYNSTTIPTNNNQLTNGAGYITDGNTNWNNTYGFITGLNWTELGGAQEEINISGFNNDLTLSSFTNDTGYVSGDTFDNAGTYANLRAQATTKGDVGLGNVTNESKATMFSSPAFTGNPTAPTQTSTNDSTRIATTAFVQNRIDEIIGNAGSTLDTLGELSASLSDDQDALTSLTTTVGTKLAKSSNLSDLTNASTARTNLGLGTAATTNSTAYATAAQGTLADSALQSLGSVTGHTDVTSAGSGAIITSAERTKLSGISAGANNYTHPTHPGDDASIDTGALTGATVISDLDFNITTDTLGHVTDANATVATRNLTLANLGYTGDTNANYITNNNQLTNGAGYITSYVNTQRSDEEIRDVASAQWINGTNTTVVKNDAGNTIKINAVNTNTQRSDEEIRNVTINQLQEGDNVTLSVEDATIVISSADTNTQLSTAQVRSKFSGTGINTTTGVITNTTYSVGDGGLTQKNFTTTLKDKLDGIAAGANNYSHPTYNGDDFSVDTGALTGATVVSDIDINVTTDGQGHVTDANGSVSTRTLTLANLGYTGAANANYITNNNQLSNGAGYLTSTNDRVYITDSRGAERLPSFYDDRYAQWDFQSSADTNAGGDGWHAIQTISKWSSFNDSHRQEQLIFTGDNLKRRTAVSDTEWGGLKTIWDSGNLDAFVGASVSNDTITFTKANGGTVAVSTSDANTNYYLNGISKSGNTLTFSVYGTTNRSYTFGSNAFTSYGNHVGLYDTVGTAASEAGEVNTRIDEEVLPLIQTPAITSNGTTPSLNSGISATEIRSVIDAQVSGTYNTIIGTDSDINTSGATIIDNLYMTDGVITSHGTRALTLADLGYTGATNANYITNNNQLTNGAGYQTSAQVNTAIQTVVDSAPAALDTLNELAAALGDDANFAGTMTTALAGKLSTTGKAADSNLLDGLDLSTGRNNEANKVVRTNSSGYAEFGWINTTSGNTTNTITDFYVNTNDGYIRKATKAHVKSQLGLGSAAYVNTSAFDAAGSAEVVNQRIDNEVLAIIPTNNDQLDNGAGYITDGNQNWNNSYGFITATSTDTLTNKSGNISQWTNDAGYITSYVNTNQLTTFQVEDGDGTEVTISHGKEWKFVEAGGININWTDTSNGSDADPYDLSFSINTGVTAGNGLTGGGTLNATRTLNVGQGTGISVTADAVSLATAGPGAGTYGSTADGTKIDTITLDAYGRVTAVATGGTGTGNGDITGVTAGTGLSGGGSSGTPTLNIHYTGEDNAILSAVNASGQIIEPGAKIWYSNDATIAHANVSDLPFTNNSGTVTSVGITTSAGLDGSGTITSTGTVNISLDLSELTDMTGAVSPTVDELILLDNGAERRKRFSEIFGSNAYNSTTIPTNNNQLENGAGYITSYVNTTYSAGSGLTLSGTTFNVQNDLRGEVTLIGASGADYINVTGTYIDFVLDNAVDMRLLNNGTLHVEGDVIAYSTTISDERLKDNVSTIENPLDKIKALRGVEYDWNSGSRKGKHDLGLIAQEVEEVLPHIVHEHEMPLMDGAEDGVTYKTVDYEKMVAVLIEGMKEQQSQIDSLKSEINELKGRV